MWKQCLARPGRLWVQAWIALSGLGLVMAAHGDEPEDLAFFETRIRPILIQHCYDCHAGSSPDAGLRLDWRGGWIQGGDSGPVVSIGQAEASRLWVAMSYHDPDLQMPPDQQLPAAVLDDFRRWIERGAVDPRTALPDAPNSSPPTTPALSVQDAQQHWAYRPLQHVDTSAALAQHPIDWMLQTEREGVGLRPTARAASPTLWRRLHLDLSGLPPTYEALQALPESADALSVAYRDRVERLLADRAFGETFARHWLDVVRYADSVTLRGLVLPHAWRYRDYVIEAYHQDRPFNQMILEQIAGDLLPPPQVDSSDEQAAIDRWQQQLIATTFLTLGNTNLETQDKRLLELDYIDEQVDVIGQAFLGQTLSCARCHDHKFDPIPTRDYYALAGILDGVSGLRHDNVSTWIERALPVGTQAAAEFQRVQDELNQVNAQLTALRNRAQASQDRRRRVDVGELPGVVVDDADAQFVGAWTESQHTTPYVGQGYRHDQNRDRGQKTATFQPPNLTPGVYELRLAYTPGDNRATNTRVDIFSAEGQSTRHLNQRPTPPLDGLWVSLGRFRFEQDGQAYVLISNEDADGHVIVDAVQWLPSPQTADAGQTAEEGQTANSNPPADPAAGDLPNLQRQIQALEQQQRALRQQLEQQPKSMAVTSKPDAADLPILVRGDHKRPGEIAPRGFLSAIRVADPPPIPPHGDARLALAQWVAANDHPLTARVYANRVWSWLMGRPLVPTSNNFGTTGEPPTHPALLDWLASELIRSGWSTKHLVRLIVTSQAYQLAVAGGGTDPSMVDPDNRYFGRGQRRRLSVEALRDAMLFASGELEFAPGGSQIKAGTIVDYHYAHDSLHRSIYQPIFRNALPDLYAEFDFADPSRSVGRRDRSTTARQALALANSPWVLARARATARRLRGPAATEAPPLAARELVINAYRTCLQRDPQPVELERCLAFLQPSIADNEPAVEAAEHDPLVDLVQALFGSIDFRFVD